MDNAVPTLPWWNRLSRRVRRVFRDPDSYDRITRGEAMLERLAVHQADGSRAILDAVEHAAKTSAGAAGATQAALQAQLAQLQGEVRAGQAALAALSTLATTDTVVGHWDKVDAAIRAENERVRAEVADRLQVLKDSLSGDITRQSESTRSELSLYIRGTAEHLGNAVNLIESVRTEMMAQAESHRAALANYFRDPTTGWELSPWKMREVEGLIRATRRRQYLDDIQSGRLAVPKLDTDFPLALESNDTKHPRGSKNDNSIAPRFNRKLYQLLGDRPGMRFLDLGCAGGGLVRSYLDDGHFAVGLDGSDYPLVNQTGEWGTIARHLFTCDVTRPFYLSDADTGEPLQFDAVTGWELMEHIPDADIAGLMANVDRHLAPGGYVLFSVATFLDHDPETGVIWHVTIKPRPWWLERFRSLGFAEVPSGPLGKYDWLRGSGLCRYDWTEDDGMGFHVALRRIAEAGGAAADAA